MTCRNRVAVAYRRDGTPILADCGHYWAGDMVLCVKHEAKAMKTYPQGWRSYPGDVCKHGVYVGGCGIDWMCGRCEMGD